MTLGFLGHLLFASTTAVLAYQGALWDHIPDIPHFDIAGHFTLIGGVAFFLDGVLDYRPIVEGYGWPRVAPAGVLAVAAVEELAQALAPTRTSSLSDFAADVIGVLSLSALSRWLAKRSLGQ